MKDELRFVYRTSLPILTLKQDDIKKYVVIKSDDFFKNFTARAESSSRPGCSYKPGHQWTVREIRHTRCDDLGSMQDFINNLEEV